MFEVTLEEQTLLFLQACALGVALGLFYDMFRIAEFIVHTNVLIKSISDFIFSAVSVIAILLFTVFAADGVFRSYVTLGIILGLSLYFASASAYLRKTAHAVIDAVIHAVRVTAAPVGRLCKYVYEKIRSVYAFCMTSLKKILPKIGKNSKNL